MDPMVVQAMQRWPNVPHRYGWLGLDARGNWYMRDDTAQAQGAFASGLNPVPRAARSSTTNSSHSSSATTRVTRWGSGTFKTGRSGCMWNWRLTPWVWRVDSMQRICAHDGQVTRCPAALRGRPGSTRTYTPLGFGLVHTQRHGACRRSD